MDNYSNGYTCDRCDEKIPHMTKSLQLEPTALRWEKYGQCCVSCVSTGTVSTTVKSVTLKETLPDTTHYQRSDNPDISLDQFYNSEAYYNNSGEKVTRRMDGERSILCGKILSAIGTIAVLSFFYTEIIILAITGLPLILFGIVLCRFGVWRKCRYKLKPGDY